MHDDSMQDLEIFLNAPRGASRSELDFYLDQACGSDSGLRRRVEELIEAESSAAEFMRRMPGDGPEGETARSMENNESPGEMIGPYKLLEKIGEGGFGTVWMAEQHRPVARRVALKVIKLGMDTREVIARFEAERQALAMMDHPSIAKVLEAGATDSGRPYFVMELVKGITITKYCRERRLSIHQRLAVFLDVCSAVQHAHQKGVIHRDLKPSNILVTEQGDKPVPKVIDFGIAKATQQALTDKTLLTRCDQFVGTPAYMSPEQAAFSGLDVDSRSDIYSLGVLLYELLVGRPPFDARSLLSAGYDEMRRIIREEEPPKPSSRFSTMTEDERTAISRDLSLENGKLRKVVRGDLDWVVMKAIEKDRTRRYETADALAADIGRHLADEPVLAAAPSALYKFRKFARRNKAALGIVALITVVMMTATVVSIGQAIRATQAEEIASEKFEESEAIARIMTEIFQSPSPGLDGRSVTVAEMLDRAVERLDRDLGSQPKRLARLQAVLGDTYRVLGLYQEALPLQEQVRHYYRATRGAEHPRTLQAMHDLAITLHEVGRRPESLGLREEVLRVRRRVLGPEHPDTIESMAHLANIYASLGRLDECFELRQQVLPLSRKVNGENHPATLYAMGNLAISYGRRSREEEALAMRQQVYETSRETLGPRHPDTLRAMSNLAHDYLNRGQPDAALALQEAIVEIRAEIHGDEHPATLKVKGDLANSYRRVGRLGEAEELLELVSAKQESMLGLRHRHTLSTYSQLARLYGSVGRGSEAIDLQRKMLVLSEEINGVGHPDVMSGKEGLAGLLRGAGRTDEEVALRREVFEYRLTKNGAEAVETLGAMTSLALSLAGAGQLEEGIRLLEESLEIMRRVLPPDHAYLAVVFREMEELYIQHGRGDALLKLRRKILDERLKHDGAEGIETLGAMTNLAISLAGTGQLKEAVKLQEECLEIKRRVLPPGHRYHVVALGHMESLYSQAGRPDELLKIRREIFDHRLKEDGAEAVETLGAMTNLAISYGMVGRVQEAIELQEECLEIKRRVLPPNHSFLAVALRHMADLYRQADRTDDVVRMRKEWFGVCKETQGPESGVTLDAMMRLTAALADNRQLEEAIELQEESLEIKRRVLSPGHPQMLAAFRQMGGLYEHAGRKDDLLRVQRELFDICRESQGPESAVTLGAMTNLAFSLAGTGDLAEAIKLQEACLEIKRRALSPDHPYFAVALRHMAELYEQTDRDDEAAALRTELRALENGN